MFPYLARELKRTGINRLMLWDEYRRKYPEEYSYSQFCYHLQVWLNASEVTMHLEHKAGDKMFIDFAGKKLSIVDLETGELKPVETFVAILGASELTYVEAMESQRKEDWIDANENALWYFGGVPAALVPDNLKSGVTKGSKYEPEINSEYADFARHYGTVILPARPHSEKDKALVENAIRLVYSRIYASLRNRTFYSLGELNEAIWELLEKHNNMRFQRLEKSGQHPEQAFKVCLGILSLSKKYGGKRLCRACRRALQFYSYSYKAVKNILDKGLDMMEEEAVCPKSLPLHENIRGSMYYSSEEVL